MQKFLILGLIFLIILVGGSTLFLNLASRFTSWNTTQSALSVCESDTRMAVINVTVTNNGKSSITAAAKDSQTGKTILLGTVLSHQQKTGVIETGKTDIEGGTITFTLSQGFVSIKKIVSYAAITGCADINVIPHTVPSPTATLPQSKSSHLPATGSPFTLWFLLLAGIPVGYYFRKFARKNL